jgi:hypothetical protein
MQNRFGVISFRTKTAGQLDSANGCTRREQGPRCAWLYKKPATPLAPSTSLEPARSVGTKVRAYRTKYAGPKVLPLDVVATLVPIAKEDDP